MTGNFVKSVLAVIAIVGWLAISAVAQDDGVQTRSITSDDFKAKRPAAPPNSSSGAKRRSTTYKFVRVERKPRRTSGTGARPSTPTPKGRAEVDKKVSEIGLTMWRLRPPMTSESGYYFTFRKDSGSTENLIAERVSPASGFRLGDKVRLAIESSVEGYLYVVDRETFSDGSLGPAYAIFPEDSEENNKVGPGLLFDIPYAMESNPWFNLVNRPDTKQTWNGELLTIIISPTPLPWFRSDKEGKVENLATLEKLEDASESDVFDRIDTGDKIFSKTEAAASCGEATRGLERQKRVESPCGSRAKQLNRDEAEPQSIFRVRSDVGQPLVAFVRIDVRR